MLDAIEQETHEIIAALRLAETRTLR